MRPSDLFKCHQHPLRQLFARVRHQITGCLLRAAVGLNGVQIGKGDDSQLAGSLVKRELAPSSVVVCLVAVSIRRDALDTYGVQLTQLDEVQRQL